MPRTGRWDVISPGLHSWHCRCPLARPNAPRDTISASTGDDADRDDVTGSNVGATSRARLAPAVSDGQLPMNQMRTR